TLEGPDDMPAHVKSVLIGPALTLPVRDGELALGTWQGIYLCAHRHRGGSRTLIATPHGEPSSPSPAPARLVRAVPGDGLRRRPPLRARLAPRPFAGAPASAPFSAPSPAAALAASRSSR